MATTIGPARGVIRGATIVLNEPVPLPEGSEVMVSIQATVAAKDPDSLSASALAQAFGGWADDLEGLDDYLSWNRQWR